MKAVVAENLTFSYGGGKPVLRDISFSVSKGEMLVIAGASGCGKTTLCRILAGIIPHSIKGDLTGKISILDIDPRERSLSQTALRAGLVFQDADSQIICTTVEDELAFALENSCMKPEGIRHRVNELAADFNLSNMLLTNPAFLSGGQKKLLTIAAVLGLDPSVLILDEPMSGLDSEGRELVLSEIQRQRDSGRAVIIVEHDLGLVANADKWLLLRDGIIAAYGTPADIISKHEDLLRDTGVRE